MRTIDQEPGHNFSVGCAFVFFWIVSIRSSDVIETYVGRNGPTLMFSSDLMLCSLWSTAGNQRAGERWVQREKRERWR